MVDRIQLLRNVGQFDNVAPAQQLGFEKLTVVYAENGRGKTTLAAVLRSLGSGDAAAITERKRLGAAHDPHVIVNLGAGGLATFANGAWSVADSRVAVFDDEFVATNVCQGIAVDAAQRENLHELVIGAHGVALANAVQGHIDQIEVHNRELRAKAAEIPAAVRGRFSVDDFCALQSLPDIDPQIEAAQSRLAAARASAEIADAAGLPALSLPSIGVDDLRALLETTLADLDASAAEQVQEHAARLGSGAERWLDAGLEYTDRLARAGERDCPFCRQDLAGSAMVAHYRAYFGQAYTDLKQRVADAAAELQARHGGDVPAAFERRVREAGERCEFWSRFVQVPEVNLDTAAIARAWKQAREGVEQLLRQKRDALLERLQLPGDVVQAVGAFHVEVERVRLLSDALARANEQVARVKAEAGEANVSTLEGTLSDLRTARARHERPIDAACQAYTSELAAKRAEEVARDQARSQLDNYRTAIFPQYRDRVNAYLRRFNAGFQIGAMRAVNHRGGSSADYNFVVNGNDVALGSFRSTLSAGDRNTLALVFFFATLDGDPNLADKVVVIDDPMTSLDEHRSLHTVQEIFLLTERVQKIIVLSHSKQFLFDVWIKSFRVGRNAIEVRRAGQSSTLVAWNVEGDMVSAVDKVHEKTRAYLAHGADADGRREVATGLRPIMERFARIAFPDVWAPGMMLGRFHDLAHQRLGQANEILGPNDTLELRHLLDYANRFHHDSNPAYQTEVVIDAELRDYAERTLRFATRPRA